LLGKTNVFSKGRWVESKINFSVPSDINVIAIGPDCSLLKADVDLADSTTFLDFYVYYLDDLHLLQTKDFHFSYIKGVNGDLCTIDSVLKAPTFANASYQWYKNNIAIIGSTGDSYHIPKTNSTGNYNVRIITADSCLISEPFFWGPGELSNLNIPSDTILCEADTLLLAPPLNGINYNFNGVNSSVVKVFKEGVYDIAATDANGCTKNFNINVHSQTCKIYIPNGFTPNGDGKNDVFRIPQGIQIQLNEFSIFDRWGNKVFSTTNSSIGWDGNSNGKDCPAGTYVYIIKGIANNKEKELKGTITLIR
jgi:gliding motility-associated-like protein